MCTPAYVYVLYVHRTTACINDLPANPLFAANPPESSLQLLLQQLSQFLEIPELENKARSGSM